ncbi:MAG: SusD/RagB family nutrient-binding outer membrane lipoprotein [Bacteroidales bacterium]
MVEEVKEVVSFLIDNVEMEFLKAEAAERGGYDVSEDPGDYYHDGIEASIRYWGQTLDVPKVVLDDQVNDYLARTDVAYDDAEGDWRQKIGLQKWIALYNRGCEAWSSWRVLDHPEFEVTDDMGTKYDEVPVRYPYPFDEPRLNEANYNEAVSDMGGEDSPLVKLFWDVN